VRPFDVYGAFLVVFGVLGSFMTVMAYEGWFHRYLVFGGAVLFTILIIGVARGIPDDFESRDSIVRASSFGLVYGAPPGVLSLLGWFLVYDNVLLFGFGLLLAFVMTAIVFPGSPAYRSTRPFVLSMIVSLFGFVMFGLLCVSPAIDAYAATQDWLPTEEVKMMAAALLGILWAAICDKLSDKAFQAYYSEQENSLRGQ